MRIELDPVKYEVFFQRLRSILEEGRIAVSMVSGSPAIVEGGECMTSFYNGVGDAVLTASGTLFHVTGSGEAIRKTIEWDEEDPGICDGDQFFYGDPYIAGTHLMDQIMIKPIFWEGKRVAWVGTMTHTGDIGGTLRGISKEIYHEGIRIQGMKIVEQGRVRKDLLRCITEQCRDPDYVGLDIMARIASNNVCAEGFLQLVERFGLDFVTHAMAKTMSDSQRMVRDKLLTLPDGTWRSRVYVNNTIENESGEEVVLPLKVMCTMTKERDQLHFDFAGTSAQNEDYYNATFPASKANLFIALAGFLFWDIPWNAGLAEMVKVQIPEGSMLNCRFPASCGMGTACGLQLTSAAMACISKMLYAAGYRDYVNSCWGTIAANAASGGPGSWYGGHSQFGGIVGQGTYDLFGSGQGAAPVRDGNDAGGAYPNAKSCISDVEWVEMYFPFLFLARNLAKDSGGNGKFRGGRDLEAIQLVYGTKDLSVNYVPLPEGEEVRGTAMFGGYATGNYEGTSKLVVSDEAKLRDAFEQGIYPTTYSELEPEWGTNIRTEKSFKIKRQLGGIRINVPENSMIAYHYSPGAGYGDPIDRDPFKVLEDIRNEAVSLEWAARAYGVIIDEKTLQIDFAATEQRREEIRQDRLESGTRLAVKNCSGSEEKDRKPLLRVHEYLEVVETGKGEKVIGCVKCGHEFCRIGENYKEHALCWTKDVSEVKRTCGKGGIHRYQEYICPECGTLLEVDVWCPELDGPEPLWDIDVKL